jgi:hypothetical protein
MRAAKLTILTAAMGLFLALATCRAQADDRSHRSFHFNCCSPIFPSPFAPFGTGFGLGFRSPFGFGPGYGPGFPYGLGYGYGFAHSPGYSYGSYGDPLGTPLPGYYFSLPQPTQPPAAYGPSYSQPGPSFYFYYHY